MKRKDEQGQKPQNRRRRGQELRPYPADARLPERVLERPSVRRECFGLGHEDEPVLNRDAEEPH